MTTTGTTSYVYVRDHGSALTTDAPVGTTVLDVEFAADFDEDGGWLTFGDGFVYGYTTADHDAETVTLDEPLPVAAATDDLVNVVDSSGAPVVTWFAQVNLDDPDSPDAIDCEIPANLVDKFAEGPIDPPLPVVVSPASGSWEVVDAPGRELTNQSRDYSPGDSGWAFGPTVAQLPNAQVTGSLGADVVTANTIILSGRDLAVQVLNPLPLGMIASYIVDDGVTTAAVTTETIMFIFNVGALKAGRKYQIGYRCQTTTTVSPSDAYRVQLRYTLDGTVPTLSSPILDRSPLIQLGTAASAGSTFLNIFSMVLTADAPTVMLALTGNRVSGTAGTFQLRSNQPTGLEMWVSDSGLAAGIGGRGAQVSKSTGTPDPPPFGEYTETFAATAKQTYTQDAQPYDTGDNDCAVGVVQGGDQATTLVGFDDAGIRDDLAGATITGVTLRFRVKSAADAAGLDVSVNSHNFDPLPATYLTGGDQIGSRDDSAAGSTYTIDLPTTFGDDLRDGNAKGIGFFAWSNTAGYTGSIYGPGSGSEPALTISYTK